MTTIHSLLDEAAKRIALGVSQKLYHGSDFEFEVGKTYRWEGKGTGWFDEWEGLFDRFRPSGAPSRLRSFFSTPQRHKALEFGSTLYLVEPVGESVTCAFGWLGLLMRYRHPEKTGILWHDILKLGKNETDIARYCVEKYYSGEPPTKNDFEMFGVTPNDDSNLIEVLSPKIKIVKNLGKR